MKANEFRATLRRHLEALADTVLWRIVISGEVVELTGQAILRQGVELAQRHTTAPEAGVVLLLLPHSVELFLLHIGLILEGRIPAILAWPTSRVDAEKYQRNILHQLRSLPAAQLVTLPKLAANLGPGLPYPATPIAVANAANLEKSFLHFEIDAAAERKRTVARAPVDAVFLQFSGGTTGAQKAVVVTAPMLDAQLRRLAESVQFTGQDTVVSWLPLYHDMGLIGCLWFPLWHGAPSVQFSATDWLLSPDLLFRYMETYRGAFCWLPNFAFSYLASQRGRMKQTYRLDHVRGWISCSEPVRRASMEDFRRTFADWGVQAGSLQASYAMAENVFAVTQTRLGTPPPGFPRSGVKHRTAAYSHLAYDVIDDVYVSSGQTLAGMEIRIVDSDRLCEDAEPGEIQIRTESLFCGYWGNDGFTGNSVSAAGWYSTGDYGFLVRGELYVIGRMKDIVIVAGQNVFPEDVESIANTVEGIYPGRVVAFGVEDEQYGTETIVVIAELRGAYDAAIARELRREIQRAVLSGIGIAPRYVYVVPERWIVKSTAGKISRRETRARFQQERENLTRAAAS
jgi:fatty-acyl-CoA synthase